jgi:CRP-like cAMP-binding protein
MRWLIEGHAALSTPVMLKGDLAPEVQRKVAAGLQAVDRVLLLQSSPLLKGATGTQLLRLASSARDVTFKAGVDPLANTIGPSMLIVLTGTLAVTTPDGRTESADSGDVIGMFQTLSGKPLGATVSATTDGTALRFTRTDLFEVLGDETALLQSVFAGLLHTASRGAAEVQPASPA